MGSIIVSMPNPDNAIRIKEIVQNSGLCEEVIICKQGSEILAKIENQQVHLVICTIKFSDMGYEELSSYLPPTVNLLLLTKNAALVPFSSNVVKLLMPFKTEDLIGTIRTLLPDQYYNRKKKKTGRTVEEQKIIDDAKQLLLDRNDMTEPEAYRYIQKVSMDTGRTLVESAQMILLLNSE